MTTGADPLSELCRAVEKDAEQENKAINAARIDSSLKDRARNGTNNLDHAACSLSPVDALVGMYRTGCETEGVEPCDEHLRLLASIPPRLVVDTRRCVARPLCGTPGGAVLRVTSGSPEQLGILLITLAPPAFAEAIALLDTLDLTGVRTSHEALAGMLDNALSWGPWWRLRCLVLRDCGLTPMHLRALGRLDTAPSLWNLEVLDLSDNVQVGMDPATGFLRGPEEYACADVAFLVYLWRQAKLRRISLRGCKLHTSATECLLKVLQSYHLSNDRGIECGDLIHGGTRLSLECLELDACDDTIVGTISSLITKLPNLKCLDAPGISDAARLRLGDLIRHRGQNEDANFLYNGQGDREAVWKLGCPIFDVEPSGRGDGQNNGGHYHVEQVPTVAEEIGKANTDPSTSGPCNSTAIRAENFDPTTTLPPSSHLLPEATEDIGSDLGLAKITVESIYQRLPKELLDNFGLNETIQPPCASSGAAIPAGDAVGPMATASIDTYGLNIVSPGKITLRKHGADHHGLEDRHGRKYGDDVDDSLPVRGIDISSEEGDDNDDNESSTSESEEDRSICDDQNVKEDGLRQIGDRPRKRSTIDQINFKMRDGSLDEDSKLGRIYRATAKKIIASISDHDKKKAAKRAFSLWDQCTENSWDRRRWTNPSKTQNDEPHILGQLNLLFDILFEEGVEIGFPFPQWRRGKGATAFLPEQDGHTAVEIKKHESRIPAGTVEADVTPTGNRPKKRKAVLMSESESASDDNGSIH